MSSLMSMYIAEGFSEDCEELMYRCKKLTKVTYDKFAVIWKEMNFSTIYYGRKYCTEAAELSQEVLHIGKRYMVRNSNSFEESVAGLFLVYGLLNLQPFQRFASLRLVPEDVAAIKKIEETARRNRRIDVLYILGSVLIHGPCQYQAELREYGLELALKKYREGGLGLERQEARPKGLFNRQSDEHEIIKEISELNELYAQSKAFFNKGKHIDVNLNYADKNLPTELETSLHEVINGLYIDEEKTKDSQNRQEDYGTKVQDIKARAIKNAVGSIRHLTGIAEREKSREDQSATSKETKKITDKRKSECINKRNIGQITGKKRSAVTRSHNHSKKRRDLDSKSNELSEDCSSINFENEHGDLNSSGGTNRIVIDSVNRSAELAKENQIVLEIDGSATAVNVDLIPVVIHSGSSVEEIEFEIIDQYHEGGHITELNNQPKYDDPEVLRLKVGTRVYPSKKSKLKCIEAKADVSKDDGLPQLLPDSASTIDEVNSDIPCSRSLRCNSKNADVSSKANKVDITTEKNSKKTKGAHVSKANIVDNSTENKNNKKTRGADLSSKANIVDNSTDYKNNKKTKSADVSSKANIVDKSTAKHSKKTDSTADVSSKANIIDKSTTNKNNKKTNKCKSKKK